jgi:hypothetical protein
MSSTSVRIKASFKNSCGLEMTARVTRDVHTGLLHKQPAASPERPQQRQREQLKPAVGSESVDTALCSNAPAQERKRSLGEKQ